MRNNNVSNIQDEDSHTITRLVFGIVGIWFLLAFVGGMLGIFYTPNEPPLFVGLFILVPIIGFILAYAVSMRMRRTVNQFPLWLMTIAHVWRFVGTGFVVGAILKILPIQFGYPEGFGDIIAASFCIPLALAIRKKRFSPGLRTAFIAWNVFGIIDLIAAISLGVLYSASSFGVLRTSLSTAPMTAFPINLIPTFFVPLFILLHLLGLKRSGEVAIAEIK
ncbi:MAG: hypothetical protein WCE94_05215 [Candidatus Methanoperedens sp.]